MALKTSIELSKNNNEIIKELETKLLDISHKFEIEVKKISYDKNWELFDFFTPLQAVTLAYGFDPKFYKITQKNSEYKIYLDSSKSILSRIIDSHINYLECYNKLIDYKPIDKIYIIHFSDYFLKLKKIQSLLNVLLINLSQGHEAITLGKRFFLHNTAWEYDIKIPKENIQHFLKIKNIESEFFETTTINNENDFYKVPKNHKCVTPKTKALIETLLHFIENETGLHDAQSGVRDTIADYIIANNRYIIPENAIKKEIAPIINWTHKKEIQKT